MSQSDEQQKDIPSSSNTGSSETNGAGNGPQVQVRRLFDNTSDESDVSLDNDDKTGAETDGSSSSRGCLKSNRSRKDHAGSSSTRAVRAPQQVSWSFGAKPATPHSQPPTGLKKGISVFFVTPVVADVNWLWQAIEEKTLFPAHSPLENDDAVFKNEVLVVLNIHICFKCLNQHISVIDSRFSQSLSLLEIQLLQKCNMCCIQK